MCTFVPGALGQSLDRVDALVWALTELVVQQRTSQIAIPKYTAEKRG
jgi:phage terminase large subunit-like protein